MNICDVFADSPQLIGNSIAVNEIKVSFALSNAVWPITLANGASSVAGGGETAKAVPLQYLNDESWQVSIELPPPRENEQISYDYILRIADGSYARDWGRDRALLPIAFGWDELLVIDTWNDPGASKMFFTPSRSRRFCSRPITPR